jgi:(p)ppGpp synthase/HD superfamily hydrolase
MHPFAQTNIQLYNQLHSAFYPDSDQLLIHRAYALAVELFTSCFRASGKPFLAHAVGTASILASLQLPASHVAAGLLHAAYALGEFGTGWKGMTEVKRTRLRNRVGQEVEDLVARYTMYGWSGRDIRNIRARIDAISPEERSVLVIRLANELEDHLDAGILYCRDAERREDHLRSSLCLCVEIAERLGIQDLASQLSQTFQQTLSASVSSSLRGPNHATFSVAPASHRLRLGHALRGLLGRR